MAIERLVIRWPEHVCVSAFELNKRARLIRGRLVDNPYCGPVPAFWLVFEVVRKVEVMFASQDHWAGRANRRLGHVSQLDYGV